MEKGFEPRFKKGDIVYFRSHIGNKHSVSFGMVDEQFSDAVCIDMLDVAENRLVNGIPIDQFPSATEWKKLPKGWSWNTTLYEITYADTFRNKNLDIRDPSAVMLAYQEGLLVKAGQKFGGTIETEITVEGYRIRKVYPWYTKRVTRTSIRPDRVYHSYGEAQNEVDEIVSEIERQATLTDQEWSIEHIDETLRQYKMIYDISAETIEKYRAWLLGMQNIEDLVVRLYDGNLQWRYERGNRKWSNIEL